MLLTLCAKREESLVAVPADTSSMLSYLHTFV
jgi:hypothetical protein